MVANHKSTLPNSREEQRLEDPGLVSVGLEILLIKRTLFSFISVKLSDEMVGASLFYNDSVIGSLYQTKARPIQPDVHRAVSSASAANFIFPEKNIL